MKTTKKGVKIDKSISISFWTIMVWSSCAAVFSNAYFHLFIDQMQTNQSKWTQCKTPLTWVVACDDAMNRNISSQCHYGFHVKLEIIPTQAPCKWKLRHPTHALHGKKHVLQCLPCGNGTSCFKSSPHIRVNLTHWYMLCAVKCSNRFLAWNLRVRSISFMIL